MPNVRTMNRIYVAGSITKQPIVRVISDTFKVAEFTVSTFTDVFNKKTNEWESIPEFIRVSTSHPILVKIIERLNQKDYVFVEGCLKTESWEKNGVKQYATKVDPTTIVDGSGHSVSKPADNAPATNIAAPATVPASTVPANVEILEDNTPLFEDDDVPF